MTGDHAACPPAVPLRAGRRHDAPPLLPDPERGKLPLGKYGTSWIKERPNLRPKTLELYRWLFERHVLPDLDGGQMVFAPPKSRAFADLGPRPWPGRRRLGWWSLGDLNP
ncbi:hypothetical protein [Actinoallomurus acaciae]|uniref:Uncharacterized protein n=1 Tax=Actinoallomurus acaciae TaxID=502577 RepID=A0ABV5YBV1_9ACTN